MYKILVLLGLAALSKGIASEDKVDYLPMMDTFTNFELYSGYLTVTTTKKLHYLFATS
jgi:hypothetical protein